MVLWFECEMSHTSCVWALGTQWNCLGRLWSLWNIDSVGGPWKLQPCCISGPWLSICHWQCLTRYRVPQLQTAPIQLLCLLHHGRRIIPLTVRPNEPLLRYITIIRHDITAMREVKNIHVSEAKAEHLTFILHCLGTYGMEECIISILWCGEPTS